MRKQFFPGDAKCWSLGRVALYICEFLGRQAGMFLGLFVKDQQPRGKPYKTKGTRDNKCFLPSPIKYDHRDDQRGHKALLIFVPELKMPVARALSFFG